MFRRREVTRLFSTAPSPLATLLRKTWRIGGETNTRLAVSDYVTRIRNDANAALQAEPENVRMRLRTVQRDAARDGAHGMRLLKLHGDAACVVADVCTALCDLAAEAALPESVQRWYQRIGLA